MSRFSGPSAILGTCLLVVTGLSVLLAYRVDPPILEPVAAATPDNPSCKPCMRPDGSESGRSNTAPNVTGVTLDKIEVRIPCPGVEATTTAESRVEVNVTAEDADGDVLTYNYVISGGRIVGQGKKVFWDLTKIRAGTYTITAGVDDGCGICGRTMTKLLKVDECSSSE